jgi:hypothetical protein
MAMKALWKDEFNKENIGKRKREMHRRNHTLKSTKDLYIYDSLG